MFFSPTWEIVISLCGILVLLGLWYSHRKSRKRREHHNAIQSVLLAKEIAAEYKENEGHVIFPPGLNVWEGFGRVSMWYEYSYGGRSVRVPEEYHDYADIIGVKC